MKLPAINYERQVQQLGRFDISGPMRVASAQAQAAQFEGAGLRSLAKSMGQLESQMRARQEEQDRHDAEIALLSAQQATVEMQLNRFDANGQAQLNNLAEPVRASVPTQSYPNNNGGVDVRQPETVSFSQVGPMQYEVDAEAIRQSHAANLSPGAAKLFNRAWAKHSLRQRIRKGEEALALARKESLEQTGKAVEGLLLDALRGNEDNPIKANDAMVAALGEAKSLIRSRVEAGLISAVEGRALITDLGSRIEMLPIEEAIADRDIERMQFYFDRLEDDGYAGLLSNETRAALLSDLSSAMKASVEARKFKFRTEIAQRMAQFEIDADNGRFNHRLALAAVQEGWMSTAKYASLAASSRAKAAANAAKGEKAVFDLSRGAAPVTGKAERAYDKAFENLLKRYEELAEQGEEVPTVADAIIQVTNLNRHPPRGASSRLNAMLTGGVEAEQLAAFDIIRRINADGVRAKLVNRLDKRNQRLYTALEEGALRQQDPTETIRMFRVGEQRPDREKTTQREVFNAYIDEGDETSVSRVNEAIAAALESTDVSFISARVRSDILREAEEFSYNTTPENALRLAVQQAINSGAIATIDFSEDRVIATTMSPTTTHGIPRAEMPNVLAEYKYGLGFDESVTLHIVPTRETEMNPLKHGYLVQVDTPDGGRQTLPERFNPTSDNLKMYFERARNRRVKEAQEGRQRAEEAREIIPTLEPDFGGMPSRYEETRERARQRTEAAQAREATNEEKAEAAEDAERAERVRQETEQYLRRQREGQSLVR